MRVLWFGTYSLGGGYPRNTVLIDALRTVGVEVVECHAPLFDNASEKIAAVTTARGIAGFGARAALAWARLAAGYFTKGDRDVIVVGYTGHLDLFLARALSVFWRKPIVLDAFLSPFDTIVNDRKLLEDGSTPARMLYHLERQALRLSDLVLTDTGAHADFMSSKFRVRRERFVPIPVGSLVEAPVKARVPVAVGAAEEKPPFTAFFCGTFVPLQGVSYILEAAERAPDLNFHIVGDGPDGATVAEEVKRRSMGNVYMERRFIERDVLEEKMANADAVLGVFGRTPKSRRVVPCKVYDGLAAGLPVVTGDGPGPEELLTHGRDALLVDRNDTDSLIRALRRLRDDPALADRLRAGARRLAKERFGKKAIGLRLKAALAKVVRK